MAICKLGDLVAVKNIREDSPSTSQYERFVGLEHFDTGALVINRWGATEKLESSMKVFSAGDVLVARRNVYLRRASRVDFDGLASGDAIILEVKDESYRDLVPFVLNTDSFWDYANQHADGSMSKRLSPQLLLEYEFDLPDIATQRRLADLLWAMEDTKTAYKKLIAATDDLVKSQFVEMFGTGDFPIRRLGDVCVKITDGTHKTPNYQDVGITFISAKNVVNGKLDFSDVKHISEEEYQEIQRRCQTEVGDVLLTKSGSLGSPVVVESSEPLGLFESLAVIKYDRALLNGTFLCEQIKGDAVQRQLTSNIKGVAVKHLHLNVISDTMIIVPPLGMQETFNAFVAQADKSKFAAQQALADITAAQKALMRQYLG